MLLRRGPGASHPPGAVGFPATEVAQAILASIGDAIVVTDLAGRVIYLNTAAARLSGWAAEEALGLSLTTVLPLVAEATGLAITSTACQCLLEGRSVNLEAGVVLVRRDGVEVPIGNSAAPVRDRYGAAIGAVLVFRDESEDRRVGRQLTFEATHDALTGLVNRREFDRRLARVIAGTAGSQAEHALLVLDLDGFKDVNDTGGHAAGDTLLQSLGPLLGEHLRNRDTLARLGGDEFGVLLENCPLVEAAVIAECLRDTIAATPFRWHARAFPITTSIGLIPVRVESGNLAAVQQLADAACYEAKRLGGNQVHRERRRHARASAPEDTGQGIGRTSRGTPTGGARLLAELLHGQVAPDGEDQGSPGRPGHLAWDVGPPGPPAS